MTRMICFAVAVLMGGTLAAAQALAAGEFGSSFTNEAPPALGGDLQEDYLAYSTTKEEGFDGQPTQFAADEPTAEDLQAIMPAGGDTAHDQDQADQYIAE